MMGVKHQTELTGPDEPAVTLGSLPECLRFHTALTSSCCPAQSCPVRDFSRSQIWVLQDYITGACTKKQACPREKSVRRVTFVSQCNTKGTSRALIHTSSTKSTGLWGGQDIRVLYCPRRLWWHLATSQTPLSQRTLLCLLQLETLCHC